MSHSVLIDCEAMKIVAASTQKNSVKCLAILADIMKLPDNYIIIGATPKWFKETFSFDEMLKIYSNTTGDEIKRAMPDTVLYQCVRIAEYFKIEERTLEELLTALGRPFVVTKTPAPEKGKKGQKEGGYTRPKEGTATGKVWDVCDTQMKANNGLVPAKPTVVEACEALGINASTAGTQYGKWKASL